MLGEKYITDNMYMFVKLLTLSASGHEISIQMASIVSAYHTMALYTPFTDMSCRPFS